MVHDRNRIPIGPFRALGWAVISISLLVCVAAVIPWVDRLIYLQSESFFVHQLRISFGLLLVSSPTAAE